MRNLSPPSADPPRSPPPSPPPVLGVTVAVAPAAHATPPIETCQARRTPPGTAGPIIPSWPSLQAIERRSHGRVDVEKAGRTTEGRTLWRARAGNGKKVVLVTSAIHGNERTGTEALLQILNRLGTSQDRHTRALLRQVTFVAMPMVNPDGGELNRRANVISWDQVTDRFPQLKGAPKPVPLRERRRGRQARLRPQPRLQPGLNYVPKASDLPGEQTDAGFFLSPSRVRSATRTSNCAARRARWRRTSICTTWARATG